VTRPTRRPAAAARSRGRGDRTARAAADWDRAGRGRAARERTADDARRRGDAPPVRSGDDDGALRDETVPPGAVPTPRGPARRGPKGAAAGGPARAPLPPRYRRRRLAAALIGAVVLLVVVGFGTRVLLYDAHLADVEDVTVTGLVTVPEQAVRDAAAVAPGGPLVSIDTVGIAERVAAVQGVAAVRVRRAWPHTVEIEVTERVPVALWQTPQGLFEVDTTGLSYRRAPEPPPALPRLTFAGVGPDDPATTAAITVLRELAEPLRAQVATVEVAGTQVTLGLVDERSVRWGDPERSADKSAVLGPLLGQPGTVYDVSSPDLPTVRR
jgi:cell division protein FtsQ